MSALPIEEERRALERALDTYLDTYLRLLATSALARHYVREQLRGGTWALRADVLGIERWGRVWALLTGRGGEEDVERHVDALPLPFEVTEAQQHVINICVVSWRTYGELQRSRESG